MLQVKNKNLLERKFDALVMKVCVNIRAIRNRRGYTQEKLGELTGLGRIRIVEIESRRYCPTLNTLHTLAIALGVEVADFLVTQPDAEYD